MKATRINERLARLEGAYEHLATKADIAELRGMKVTAILLGSLLAALNLVLRFVGMGANP